MSGTGHKKLPAKAATSEEALVVVVIGFSAGGLAPLRSLIESFAGSPSVAIVIAHHATRSLLPDLMKSWTSWPVAFAREGQRLYGSRIYVCPPRRHIVINPDATLSVPAKQHVHFVRPSIDWLFET